MKARRLLEMLGLDMGNMRRTNLGTPADADIILSCKHHGARAEATHDERRLLLTSFPGQRSTTVYDCIPPIGFEGKGLKMEWNHVRWFA